MNPQSISTSPLIATGHIRTMRGGAQSHMLTANDGHAYVVKFANNPQSLRVLANEWLGCSIGRALGLTIPEPAILCVPAKLVESSPSLVIRSSNSTLKCSHGLAFGSRVISEGQIFDFPLPYHKAESIPLPLAPFHFALCPSPFTLALSLGQAARARHRPFCLSARG